MTREAYDQRGMRAVRRRAIEKARKSHSWGLILGTLGRQGNPRILRHLQSMMEERGCNYTVVSFSSWLERLCCCVTTDQCSTQMLVT